MGDLNPPQPVQVQDTKKPYLSKTLWLNFIVALLALTVPAAKEFIQVHPEIVAVGWAVVNSILRLISKDALSLQD